MIAWTVLGDGACQPRSRATAAARRWIAAADRRGLVNASPSISSTSSRRILCPPASERGLVTSPAGPASRKRASQRRAVRIGTPASRAALANGTPSWRWTCRRLSRPAALSCRSVIEPPPELVSERGPFSGQPGPGPARHAKPNRAESHKAGTICFALMGPLSLHTGP